MDITELLDRIEHVTSVHTNFGSCACECYYARIEDLKQC